MYELFQFPYLILLKNAFDFKIDVPSRMVWIEHRALIEI